MSADFGFTGLPDALRGVTAATFGDSLLEGAVADVLASIVPVPVAAVVLIVDSGPFVADVLLSSSVFAVVAGDADDVVAPTDVFGFVVALGVVSVG